MRISELLSLQAIDLNTKAASKAEVIDYMTRLMEKAGNLNDREAYKKGVLAREEEGTTGIGEGIAIPHAKSAAVKKAGLAAAVIKDGVDYDSLDGEPVELAFMIAAPEGGADTHLEALARLSTMLMDPSFKEGLVNAESPEQFIRIAAHISGVHLIGDNPSFRIYDKGAALRHAVRLDIYLKILCQSMSRICQHGIANLLNPVGSVMPRLMHIMGITGDGIHFASGRPEIRILIRQILQLRGADKGEVRRIEEKNAPFSCHIRFGNRFEGTFMVSLNGKICNFSVD